MKARGRWQGMLTIMRFNWPFYTAATAVLFIALAGFWLTPGNFSKVACATGIAAAAYFLIVSLAASHIVYDRSDLYRWFWLERVLRKRSVCKAIFCHCGFDDASVDLQRALPEVQWQVLDHFNEKLMMEPSIRRARSIFPPPVGTRSSPYDVWPVPSHSADLVFGFLAIHELRTENQRTAWFAAARRCLGDAGQIVLVEHVRDAANCFAFGPGFLHFHSVASWRRCWESAGLQCSDEFSVTPFVRVFVLTAP